MLSASKSTSNNESKLETDYSTLDIKKLEKMASGFFSKGDPGAQFQLYCRIKSELRSHIPNESDKAKLKKAIEWLEKSAAQGYPLAEAKLGSYYIAEGRKLTKANNRPITTPYHSNDMFSIKSTTDHKANHTPNYSWLDEFLKEANRSPLISKGFQLLELSAAKDNIEGLLALADEQIIENDLISALSNVNRVLDGRKLDSENLLSACILMKKIYDDPKKCTRTDLTDLTEHLFWTLKCVALNNTYVFLILSDDYSDASSDDICAVAPLANNNSLLITSHETYTLAAYLMHLWNSKRSDRRYRAQRSFDEIKAISLMHSAAEKGSIDAQYYLGCCYTFLPPMRHIIGSEKFFQLEEIISNYNMQSHETLLQARQSLQHKGMEFLIQAANNGHFHAQYLMGQYCNTGTLKDSGYREYLTTDDNAIDCTSAANWYENAIESYSKLPQPIPMQYKLCLDSAKEELQNIYQLHPETRLAAYATLKHKAKTGNFEAQAELGHFYLEQKDSQAGPLLQKLATNESLITNNSTVEYDLALCHEEGLGVPQDFEQADDLFKKSAAKGNISAKAALARPMFRINLLNKKIQKGDLNAQAELGHFYLEQKDNQAGPLLQKIITNRNFVANNSTVEYDLGVCHEAGLGFSINEEIAFDYYSKSANKGNELAKKAIGRLGKTLGVKYGVKYYEERDTRAPVWLNTAIAQKSNLDKDSTAEYYLALCYEEGLGVPQDFEYADELFKISASIGNSSAKKALARPEFRINHLNYKIQKGDSIAQAELGHIYLEQSNIQAFPLLQKAVEQTLQPSPNAIYDFAICYEKGLGVTRNYVIAANHYQDAAAKNHVAARTAATRLYKDFILLSLESNSNVKSLNLQHTNIEDSDLLLLQKLFAQNLVIEKLDLRNTLVTQLCVEKFADRLKRSAGLEILHSGDKKSIVFAEHSSLNYAITQQPNRNNNVQQDEKISYSVAYTIKYDEITLDPEEIGQGSFGKVYKGEWRKTPVAVKKLIGNLTANTLEEFKNEAKIMMQLQSDYLIRFYGICLSPKYCLVMEYMSKGSLYNLLHSDQPLAWSMRYQIINDIACGLLFLHQDNILHRDIKSANVLLDTNYRAKLTDYGLSKIKNDAKTVVTSSDSVGTLPWMAPELFGRQPSYTKKSDMYSFGMTIWEVVTRKRPFEGDNAAAIISCVTQGERENIPREPECPQKIAHLIRGCWEGNTTKRWAMEDVMKSLESDINTTESTSNSGQYENNLASRVRRK